ncbi:MAG: hypothetical protein GXP53_09680 [Deltaproteobacteria bacterium]|nr:hypothetical protein [Deltaproteobacteria bacterium]
MNRIKLMAVTFLVAALLVSVPGTSAIAAEFDESPQVNGAGMIVDFFVARPIGLFSTIGGTAMFIVSLPFSALGGNVEAAAKQMVVIPARYTFLRPLGEF